MEQRGIDCISAVSYTHLDVYKRQDKGYTGTTGRNYQKSTGMGLYLCKKLCSKLQLSFYIESKEEEYTKVTIGFPRNSMIFLNEE